MVDGELHAVVSATSRESAPSLIMASVYSDMLAMLPVQFLQFAPAKGAITSIPVREHLPAPSMVLV